MKNMNKLLKVILIIFASFFIVKSFTSQIFLADTPIINPQFIFNLKNLPLTIAQIPGKMMAKISSFFVSHSKPTLVKDKSQNEPENTFFNPQQNSLVSAPKITPPSDLIWKNISKGVAAAEDPKTGNQYIQIKAGVKYKIVGTVFINGKEYPKIEFIDE